MSKMEANKIETLRREFQRTGATAAAREDCPEAETIWEALLGELPVDHRRSLVSHMASCAACRRTWRLARALQDEMRDEAEDTAATNGHDTVVAGPWKRFVPQMAAAAMLVLALGVGVMLHQPEPEPHTPVHRGAVDQEIQSLVPEGEALPREELVLRWSPGPRDATYRVRVLDDQMVELARAEDLREPAFEVPPEDLESVPSLGYVYWYVETFQAGARVNEAAFVTQVE